MPLRSFKVPDPAQDRLNRQRAADLEPLLTGPLASAQFVVAAKEQPPPVGGVRRFAAASARGQSTTLLPLVNGYNVLPNPLGRPPLVCLVTPRTPITWALVDPVVAGIDADPARWLVLAATASASATVVVA